MDLKGPHVPMLGSGRHASLSASVQKVMTQLRDYNDFFSDPRNQEELVRRFGLVPKPDIVAVIGRLPNDLDRYATLISREGPVSVIAYDEILDMRKDQLSRLRLLLDRK